MRVRLLALFPILAVLFCASSASAAPILGDQLFYTGGDVTVESLPVSSGYLSELGLYDTTLNRLRFIEYDEPAGVIVTFDPSVYGIGIGQELIFGIRVVSDSNREYFMGAGSRNPDGMMHALVDNLGGNVYVVGFEDLFGGGDLDFNDNVFQFTGAVATTAAAVPEPASLLLLGTGGAGLLARARRRRTRPAE